MSEIEIEKVGYTEIERETHYVLLSYPVFLTVLQTKQATSALVTGKIGDVLK